ncbi:hypothetical protein ACFL27_19145 [candidate division CSSED10-310 bacterium]|uniref:Lipocalin-like domain-containing protein n=1 Tax=candidate division CSSED10-310 bacterium TaxID=2855610 RepID=A0ABV6Z1J3_UNCC1
MMMRRSISLLTIALFMFALMFVCVSCGDDDDDDNDNTQQEEIVGKWLSSGDDVSVLLASLGFVSIGAQFNENNTYTVDATDNQGAVTQFVGTYVVAKSSVGNIYTITLSQSSPTVLTSEGIYEIDSSTDPDEMMYEIVQTSPDIGATPPTPDGGFGSTNGGALGDMNVQKYIRIE